MNVFEYLIEQENKDPALHFGCAKGNSMFVSYEGYKNMNLFEITEVLVKQYKLKYDFDLGIDEFDSVCCRTFVYFRDVYTN